MKTVHLTVNREPCSAHVTGRTQLAELLRDHLHLTGTHLGCEHGVCGACTVLVDGKPIRSCITWAQACEGADVVTVEGLGDDPVGRALREAFARHHALQCGFCTSGMLITAWDVVTRLAPVNEAAIRQELSGNLCRCTGYMGIVAAVQEVARQHRGEGRAPAGVEAAARSPESSALPRDFRDGRASPGADAPVLEAAPAGDDAVGGTANVTDRGDAPSAHPSAPAGDGTVPPAPGLRDGGNGRGEIPAPAGSGAVPPAPGRDEPGGAGASSALAFEPFEVEPGHLAVAGPAEAGATGTPAVRPMTQADGWTRIEREFVMGHSVDALWALFEDLSRVAECLPGVHVESADAHRFAGRAEIRFGPIGAAFHGEGTREIDAERRTGVISGRGSDARGQATLEAELRYAMSGDVARDPEPSDPEPRDPESRDPESPDPEPLDPQSRDLRLLDPRPRTRVDLAIRFRVQGGLAQFNRGDLVESFADVVLSEFVRNCERRLAGEDVRRGASGLGLLWRTIRARFGF